MPRTLKPATPEQLAEVQTTHDILRAAARNLHALGCHRAAEATRAAVRSAAGAERHMRRRLHAHQRATRGTTAPGA